MKTAQSNRPFYLVVTFLATGLAASPASVADFFRWKAGAAGDWTTLANWEQSANGVAYVAATRLPGQGVNNDRVKIDVAAATTINLTAAMVANNQIVRQFTTFATTGQVTLRVNTGATVVNKVGVICAGDLFVGTTGIFTATQFGNNQNADGADLELTSTEGTVTINGQASGGTGPGVGGRGGDVKIKSARNNGLGIDIAGVVEAGVATRAGQRGGNIILESNSADIDVSGAGTRVSAGAGANNAGGAGGAGGAISVFTDKGLVIGAAADAGIARFGGGRGGDGTTSGGRGGNIAIGAANRPIASLSNGGRLTIDAGGGGDASGVSSIAGDGGNVEIFCAGSALIQKSCSAGQGGAAAGNNKGKAGNGGFLTINADALTVDITGSLYAGDGGGGDYPGAGGKLTVNLGNGDLINHSTIRGGNGGAGKFSLNGNGDNRNLNADGGEVNLSGKGKLKNIKKAVPGAPIAQIWGGNGGSAAANNNPLQGNGRNGGDVNISFKQNSIENDVAGKASIKAGDGGFPRGAGGRPFLNGKIFPKLGNIKKALNGNGTTVSQATIIHGGTLVTIGSGDLIEGSTVEISVAQGGRITAEFLGGHGKIFAESEVRLVTGCGGLIDFSACLTNQPYGPIFYVTPVMPSDRDVVVYSGSVSAASPLSTYSDCPFQFASLAGDFSGDGFVDGFDYDDFVACFEGSVCPSGRDADFNADGFVDGFDYDDFVAAFEGC